MVLEGSVTVEILTAADRHLLLDVWIDRDAPLEGEIEVGQVGSVGVGRVQTFQDTRSQLRS